MAEIKSDPSHQLPAPIRVDSSGEANTLGGGTGKGGNVNNGGIVQTGTSWENTKSFWKGPDLTEDHGRERWAYIMHAFARTAFAGVAFLPTLMTDLATLFADDDGTYMSTYAIAVTICNNQIKQNRSNLLDGISSVTNISRIHVHHCCCIISICRQHIVRPHD
jgi:hypothetical protein